MRVKLNGKYYTVTRPYNMLNDGDCSPPNMPRRKIRLAAELDPYRLLVVAIHEALHAVDWSKDETWVEETAEDIASFVWKLGYRLDKEEAEK